MEAFSLSSAVFVAGALCLAVFLSIRFLKRKKKGEGQKIVVNTGIPEGMEEDFRCGVDPCSFGIPVMYTLHTCRHCVKLKEFLDKHGIEYEQDNENKDEYWIEYKGERMYLRMSNERPFITIFDTFWRKYPAENLEMVSTVRKAINMANLNYNGFKLLYSFNEDSMWLHTSVFMLMIPEIPDVEIFFTETLDQTIFSHRAFDEVMFEVMKEQKND